MDKDVRVVEVHIDKKWVPMQWWEMNKLLDGKPAGTSLRFRLSKKCRACIERFGLDRAPCMVVN